MGGKERSFAKMVVLAAALCLAASLVALPGCLRASGTKIPAWEVHVTEDSFEEHLAGSAWQDAEDGAHVLRFFADGTYAEEGGEGLLPDASAGAAWEVLYCSADGYTDWANVSQEQAEGRYAYRLVFRTGPNASGQIARLTIDWEGDDLILDGWRFTPRDLAGGEEG